MAAMPRPKQPSKRNLTIVKFTIESFFYLSFSVNQLSEKRLAISEASFLSPNKMAKPTMQTSRVPDSMMKLVVSNPAISKSPLNGVRCYSSKPKTVVKISSRLIICSELSRSKFVSCIIVNIIVCALLGNMIPKRAVITMI